MQLKWLVVLVVVGVQVLTAGIVAVTAWAVVTDAVETNLARATRAVADTVRLRYDRFVDPATDAVDLARFLLQQHGSLDVSLDTFERFLFNQLGDHPVVDALYFGRSTGEFLMVKRVHAPGAPTFLTKHIQGTADARTVEFRLRDRRFEPIRTWRDDDDTFDPRTRPWYRAAREQADDGDRAWTEPYVFFTSGQPGVSTANAVIGDSPENWGAVSVDIETASFSRFLSTLALPGGGEALIADWQGEVIALPSSLGPTGRTLFAETETGGRPAILEALNDTDPGLLAAARDGIVLRNLQVGGEAFIVQLLGFEDAGMPWSIVVAVPEEAVFGWIYDLRDTIVAVCLSAGILAVASLMVFWRRAIERPVAAIGARLDRIARGPDSAEPSTDGASVDARLIDAAPELRRIDAAVMAAGEIIAERERARREVIDRLSDLVEAMERAPVGIAILEPDRRVVFANRQARDALSIAEDTTARLEAASLGVSVLELEAKVALVGAGRTVRSEVRLISPDGVETDFTLLMASLGSGETARLVVVLEDVSAAKQLESGLIDAREAAERSDKAKTLFLAQMSHEFRTPLNAIVGFSELLRDVDPFDRARASEYVTHIHGSAAVLLSMIERILEYARYESGEAGAAPMPTDVVAAMRDAVATVQAQADAAGVTVELDLHGRLDPVAGDSGLLSRAFEQLLSNAIKFSASGDSIAVAVAPHRAAGIRPSVVVGIADRGCGIGSADLPHIFEPFWKSASHLRANPDGAGLGLAIARRIITGFGGQIEVDSAPDQGTRVVASLPIAAAAGGRRSNDN